VDFGGSEIGAEVGGTEYVVGTTTGTIINDGGAEIVSSAAYEYQTLDDPLGTQRTETFGINDSGQIDGYYEAGNVQTGFVYSGGIFSTLKDPLGTNQSAWDINNAGQIVGGYVDANNVAHGYVYNNGSFTSLDFPSAVATFAYGNNNFGQVVGWYDTGNTFSNRGVSGHIYQGFLYSGGT
jgi:probable HAF family extracellular repeat protein